jgi:predicted small lipoprotein YifL
LLVLASLFSLAGCDRKQAPTTEKSAASAAAPESAASAAPAIADTEIAVSEDFEEAAHQQIGDKDYRPALDAIDKELAAP